MADEIGTMTYEAALAELDGIIARLEAGEVALDAAITAYERGTLLAQHCARLLDATEQKITQLVVGSAGQQEKPLQVAGSSSAAPIPAPAPVPAPAGGLFDAPVQRARRVEPPIDPDEIPF